MFGTSNAVEVRTADGKVEQRGRFSKEELMTGDVVRFITGMGGGYGDPTKRDPRAVLADVADGYITREAARKVYRVAVIGEPAKIDEAETRRLRG
jgi:N-methylhydantoinase B